MQLVEKIVKHWNSWGYEGQPWNHHEDLKSPAASAMFDILDVVYWKYRKKDTRKTIARVKAFGKEVMDDKDQEVSGTPTETHQDMPEPKLPKKG